MASRALLLLAPLLAAASLCSCTARGRGGSEPSASAGQGGSNSAAGSSNADAGGAGAPVSGAGRGSVAAGSGGGAGTGPAAGSGGGGTSPAAGSGNDDDAGVPAVSTAQHSTERIADPPTYLGGNGCTKSFRTTGFAPSDAPGQKRPLFLYFVGTRFVDTDQSAQYDSQAALKVTEAMARRGFVALSVEYDNGIADVLSNKIDCLFGKGSDETLLTNACNMSQVDCARGIGTWGHSQGALLAHIAASFDARVKAAWTTGYGGNDNPALPYSRLRVVNGEADTMNGSYATISKAAGFTTADCPDDGRDHCLRTDGSGFILVRKSACKTSSADHCWFDRRSCTDNAITLEANWIDPKSTALFGLESNADWVAATVARP